MDAIQQHIDYLFQELPETEEIKRIKNDLYLNATDRYEELLSEGKTESEALGTIIIEMGDLDVLLESMDYDREEDLQNYSLNTLDEARSYVALNSQEASKIGMGVLVILVGAGFVPMAGTFNIAEIGVILLLGLIALAVGLFINSGLKLEAMEKSVRGEDRVFYMTKEDYNQVEEEFVLFKEKERYRIPIGVMLCILSVMPLIFFAFLENDLLVERYGVVLLMLTVGVGVYQFIKYGMVHSAYEKVLSIGEYSEEERNFQQTIEPISGIYWSVVTLVYLAWSFITMNWGFTWIIWPIAAGVWGIITLIVKQRNNQSGSHRY